MKIVLQKIVFITLGIFLVSNLCAEDLKPEDIQVETPVYTPVFSEFKPALGQYEYRVAWQGIPAADVLFNVEKNGLNYELSTSVKTYKAIDLFYKLRYRAEGVLSAVNLLPIKSFFETQEKSRIKTTRISFAPNGEISSYRVTKGKKPQRVKFNPNNFTLDPFSAAFLARSLDWSKGQSRSFDTYSGKNRYMITLSAVDQVSMNVNGETRAVWVIEPEVQKLTSSKKGKLRQARIYVTADTSREILRIDSEVLLGTIKTKLVSFKESSKSQATSVVSLRSGSQDIYFE